MVGVRPRVFLPIIFAWLSLTASGQVFDEPARALVRKIAAALEGREPVVLSFNSVPAVSSASAAAAREAIERELRAAGIAAASQASATLVITLSENVQHWVLVADLRRADTREILMEERPKPESATGAPSAVIEKHPIFDQDTRILDFALLGRDLMVLDAESVSVYQSANGSWQRKLTVRIPGSRALPRDLRGRLFVQGDIYQAYLSGRTCSGNAANGLGISCREEGLWPLGPNVRGISVATRNYFENFVLPDGFQRHTSSFFSAANLSDRGRSAWVFAETDGRVHAYDAGFVPRAAWSGWGGDIAAVETECGSRTLLLGTGPGDDASPDFVQAYELNETSPQPVGDPVSFPGPVTALWSGSERGAAVAVTRDLKSGRYAAFRLSIPCGR